MKFQKAYLAVAVASAALVGCGGSSSSDKKTVDVNTLSVCPTESFITAAEQVDGKNLCFLEGTVDKDFTLDNDANTMWGLKGFVVVGDGNQQITDALQIDTIKANGVTLTIEPGVVVRGTGDGVLVVTRGSKLMAEGTKADPITFAPLEDDKWDVEGQWGGVIVQGFATQYGLGNTGACYGSGVICNVQGEGGDAVGFYGGNEDADDSGVIKYVRITGAGKVAGPNNEVNGLTLMGVGHGTTVEYVHVHANLDDAVEWFGGTVNARYLVLTNNDDDDIDYDTGWRGNVQFAIVRKDPNKSGPTGSNDPRGIEANTANANYTPQTSAALANITIVGSDVSYAQNSRDAGNQPGILLRGAVETRIYNTAVLNFHNCVRIDDADTDGNGTMVNSNVTLVNVIGDDCVDSFYRGDREADIEDGTVGEQLFTLTAAVALASSSVTPPVMEAVQNGSGFTFDATNYVGAVAPGTTAANAWWAGWTLPGKLDGIENQRAPVQDSVVAVLAE